MAKLCDFLVEFLLVFLIVFTPLAYGSVHPWAIGIFEIIAALIFLFTFLKILHTGGIQITSASLYFFALIFIVYVCFQLFSSIYFPSNDCRSFPGSVYPWATKTELLKLISFLFIFFSVSNLIRTRRQVNRILFFMIATGFMMGIFYLVRYFGFPAPKGLINKDHYSGYLAMVVCLAVGFLFIPTVHDERDMHRTPPHFLVFFSAVIMASALFCTHSRGGMFSFLAALVVMTVLALFKGTVRQKIWIFSITVGGVLLTLLWIGVEPILERFMSIQVEITSRYFGGRVPIWQAGAGIVRDYPFFGSGFGTFGKLFELYEPWRGPNHFDHAHCDFLEFLAEAGIVGFSIIFTMGTLYVVMALKRFSLRQDPFVLGISIGLFGALAAIFFHSVTDFNLRIPSQAILVSILLALLLNILDLGHNSSDRKEVRSIDISVVTKLWPVKVIVGFFIFVLIGAITLFSWRPVMADFYCRQAINLVGDTGFKSRVAVRLFQKAIISDPLDARYHDELADIYERSLETKNALFEYHRAVKLDPTNSGYRQSLAWAYGRKARRMSFKTVVESENEAKARFYFEEAIRLEPKNPYRYQAYALWLLSGSGKENYEKGVQEYKKAVALDSGFMNEFLRKSSEK